MTPPQKRTAILLLLIATLISCSNDSTEEISITNYENLVIPNDTQFEIEILETINQYRLSQDLSLLEKLDNIKTQTYSHTQYMIEQNQISHDNFADRCAFLKEHNEDIKKIGENVARGFTTADELLQGWLNSPSHKATLQDNYTHFEITAKQNQYGIWFYSNLFVRKK